MSFQHKKSLGQHFLNSDLIPKKLCDAAAITTGDVVCEIGPGTGALTRELLARGAQVTALETDDRAILALEETFFKEIKDRQLVVVKGDARHLQLASMGYAPHTFKVVANIPYYLSGQLLRTCLDTETQPSSLVFLMQKELVERIARAKKESLLSLSVKVFGTPQYVTTVKRGHFTPVPNVDSAILAVHDISKENLVGLRSADFFALLQLGFGQKRKQLQHNLRAVYDQELVDDAIASCELPPTVRAEDISLETWLQLVNLLSQNPSL